jgi:hypothetical protein
MAQNRLVGNEELTPELIAAIVRGDYGDQVSRWSEQAANPYYGFGGRPGNLTPEQLAQLKQGITPEGFAVGIGGYESRGDQGIDSAMDPYYVLYQGMEDPTWGTAKWNTWDLNGNYLGYGSADSEARGVVKAAALAAAMYGGAAYGANAMGGEAAGAGAGGGASAGGSAGGAAAGGSSITLPTTAEVAAGMTPASASTAAGAMPAINVAGTAGTTGLSAASGGTGAGSSGGYSTAAADSQLANTQLGLSANSGSVPASVNVTNAGGTMATGSTGTAAGAFDTLQQAVNSPVGKAATSAAISGLAATGADEAASSANTASLDQLLGQFLSEMQKTSARGDDQWDDYLKTWRPIEQQYAQRALNWDTPERRAQAASEASGSVASQFDVARTQGHRDALAAGLDPSTIANMNTASLIEEAKAKAGASNQARTQVEAQGMDLLSGAANFGRNMTGTSLQASGVATGQGNSAASASNSANQLNMQATRDRNQLYGDILGAGLKAWGMYSSSEKTKHMKGKVDGLAAARAVEQSPARGWRYREGQGDGDTKDRMGPTAESLAAVAPEVSDGKQVDGIAMLGLHHAAIGGQNERLARIEEALGLASAGS